MSEQLLPMSDVSAPLGERLRTKFAASASLTRSGYSLIASSLITSALGMLFWTVAARSFSPAELGIGAALIAAMTPLAGAAQFNFKNVLYRYVSSPGPRAQRLVLGLYLASALAAVVLGTGFAMLVTWINPDLAELFQSPWIAPIFVVALIIWTIYGLQEAELVALRLSVLMPPKSLIYALAKLLALLGLATFVASGLSILAAWIVPALATGIATSALLVYYGAGADDTHTAARFTRREFVGFLGWDYVGSLAGGLTYGMAPMLVIAAAGTVAGAHFYLAFSIAYVLYLVGSQMGAAMMAEHASRSRHPRALYADALVQTVLPVAMAALATVALAPMIMQIFGKEFVEPGSTILRLLVLGAIPGSAVIVFLSICRTKGWVKVVALVQLVNMISSLGLGYILSATLGGTGMALALLSTETTIATGLAVWTLTRPGALHGLALDLACALVRLAQRLFNLAKRLSGTMQRKTIQDLDGEEWAASSYYVSLSDAQTMLPRREEGTAVLKRAHSSAGIRELELEQKTLTELHQDERVAPFGRLVPGVISFGIDGSGARLLLSKLPGRDGRTVSFATGEMTPAIEVAAEQIAQLHRQTELPDGIDADWIARWIDEPIAALRQSLPENGAALSALHRELVDHFHGSAVALGRGHGDYCLDNILFETAPGGAPMVTGIVDWGGSRRDAPAGLDGVFLVLTARARREERELGHVVRDVLARPEQAAAGLGALVAEGLSSNELRALVLLCWLNHATSNLRKSGRYGASRFWQWNNIKLVVMGYERASK
ncbi:phosphotransferase [Devosia sp.]|uniref:phosphotransferase n=1 Tax=Devosia sp. TaxID=1871048 RepID=UPI003A9582A1